MIEAVKYSEMLKRNIPNTNQQGHQTYENNQTGIKPKVITQLINEIRMLIQEMKTIIRTVTENKLEKIQTKQQTPINEPIPLSNRFSPIDIDPVETTIEDSDETTNHIKTDTINRQKKLNKKINTKDNPTENETNPIKNMKHKLQKVDIDQLQDQKKKGKYQKLTPNPPIEKQI